ncbi:ROK family protein [Allonocardiopsis opalescens]|uniref:Glucokinase n=1 Tax=Allonocardiopsis opalescens TaxID=1144618 RepID=A0A2T0QFU7_9ACTN|nr:ROK family protein [Allonocardiopsis opalescens]PRY02723.1 glucokinase [Allonocardiopsis opalescens]
MSGATTPVVGVDIGGTTITAALVHPDGTVLHTRGTATPQAADDGSTVYAALAGLVGAVIADAGGPDAVGGVGVGSAGPLDAAAGTVSPVNIPSWRGFALLDRLRADFPGLRVRLDGDAICFALGEYRHGAGHGSDGLLGMVVSTGVGGGLILDGGVYRGPTGNAGHIGHAIVDMDGPPCPCGSKGCLEVLSSGPNMVRWARAEGWAPPEGAEPTARELAEAARAGDPTALRAFARAGRAVGAAIVSAAAVVDFERVVIGGGVAQAGELLFAPVREGMAEFATLAFLRRVTVLRSALGDRAGLLGAAELVA